MNAETKNLEYLHQYIRWLRRSRQPVSHREISELVVDGRLDWADVAILGFSCRDKEVQGLQDENERLRNALAYFTNGQQP